MMNTTMKSRLAALGIAGAMALGACGSDKPAEFDTAESGAPTQSATDQAGPADDAAGEDPADETTAGAGDSDAIGATWPDPGNVIAEDVFTVPEKPGEKIRVGIESIRVSGATMELRLVMTPEERGDGIRVWDLLREGPGVSVRLIDRENLKEYSVLRTSGGDAYQPSDQIRFVAGESLGYQVFYAAPEDDIEVVDVQLSSSLPIFEDVPLTFED